MPKRRKHMTDLRENTIGHLYLVASKSGILDDVPKNEPIPYKSSKKRHLLPVLEYDNRCPIPTTHTYDCFGYYTGTWHDLYDLAREFGVARLVNARLCYEGKKKCVQGMQIRRDGEEGARAWGTIPPLPHYSRVWILESVETGETLKFRTQMDACATIGSTYKTVLRNMSLNGQYKGYKLKSVPFEHFKDMEIL
jgi:hypothetical protein